MTESQLLYLKLSEECQEVGQQVSKLLWFGPDDVYPGQPLDNIQRLDAEVHDLLAVIDMLKERRLLPDRVDPEKIRKKKDKVQFYLQYSRERGIVE